MKHKHADLIKKWADGAQLEVKMNNIWHPVERFDPFWTNPAYEFRIKPENIVEIWTIKDGIEVKATWSHDKTELKAVELVK